MKANETNSSNLRTARVGGLKTVCALALLSLSALAYAQSPAGPAEAAATAAKSADAKPAAAAPKAGTLRLAVVGAHLTGMPLNRELTERNATFAERTTTSDAYRLYALSGTVPPKPGLSRVAAGKGSAIEVELWDVPLEHVGSFLAGIPAPLGLGSLELADGRWVKGFICEGYALEQATDITRFGGWRAYRAAETKR